ncbi:hypothetical protein K8374_09665 [Pseudomonas sp. p1(2021b)]|uniref:hypothetical protein n=1 Tax=Pseudomonas sp. p1(2021b) TaxID=2874628 RepID=UPI001CCF6AD0|nr:hypothetical protein [Pseudomonas sp. p1(2021b)]UBM27197.1 hypothetical protein K8374_09665 [Pseudomonas sp. p1(2021b)]
MAEYGFSAINDFASVTISSVYKVLVFSERGTYQVTSRYTDRGGEGAVTFEKPIATKEAPQVFVRVQSASHATLGIYISMVGSPGHWTGFRTFSAAPGSSPLQNFTLEYVACKFADTFQATGYGMDISDSSGLPVFSAKDKIVRYSKFAKNWAMVVNSDSYRVFSPDISVDVDDFICVSSFDRGLSWAIDNSQFSAFNIWLNWAPNLNSYVQRITSGGYWYWQGTNNTNFTVPVCKFPISRYSND